MKGTTTMKNLILAVFLTPVQAIALRYLLIAHLLQNVVLAEWAPALYVAGLSPALAAALGRLPGWRFLTSPFVASGSLPTGTSSSSPTR